MNRVPISPLLSYLGISLSFGLSLALHHVGLVDIDTFFYAPLALLISYHTLYALLTDRDRYLERSWRQVFPKAIGKYLLWGLLLWGILQFYQAHPLYRDFTPNTRRFVEHFLWLFSVAGLPYFLLAEKYRFSLDNSLGDPYLKVLSLLKALRKGRYRLVRHRLCRRSYRKLYLMSFIRIHYLPIMAEQIYYGMTNLARYLQGAEGHWNLSSGLLAIFTAAWLIDSNNGAMGYFWESWFTKTRFREMDSNPAHWFLVLICYIPFIHFATQFVPFHSLPDGSELLLQHAGINRAIEVVLAVALVVYMLSTSALAFATSNLCYKKIQTRGPYRFVRHPATTCKVVFFSLAFFRYREAYSLAGLLSFLVWTTVYICRARLEERFLGRYADYRAYMQKTRYRFIPWVC